MTYFMSETLKKLEDSRILFQQAKDSTADPSKIRANLSSCIESLRSVTWIMQKEYAHVSGFQEWYSIKQEEMKDDKILKQFKNLRNTSVKEKSIIRKGRITIKHEPKVKGVKEKTRIVIKNIDGKIIIENPDNPKSNTKIEYFFDENDYSVVELTASCLEKIEKLVNECISKFNKQ